MIKCNVTVCGVIGSDASIHTNKEGTAFLVFPLRVAVPAVKGEDKPVTVNVRRKDGGQEEAEGYRSGLRVEATGTMYMKRRGEKLYFNLFPDEIRTAAADAADKIEGELTFRGKAGRSIEQRKDKNDKPYTVFSAFSAEKVDDGFEYQWIRFFCFGKEREEWLQPGVRVEAKGEMTLSAHDGKLNLSCRAEEVTPCAADSSDSNE